MALLHNIQVNAQVTYSQLMTLISGGSLNPGFFYEITDYRTIYTQAQSGIVLGGSGSAHPSNPFPLIVQATSGTSLGCDAWAVPTTTYPNANQWKLKYDAILTQPFQYPTSLDWAAFPTDPTDVSNIIANATNIFTNLYGQTFTGTTISQLQTYIDTTFAASQSLTADQAEVLFYQDYVAGSFSPTIPVNISTAHAKKYNWSDTTSLGVIYEMEDEFGNRATYDFKNVRFRRYKSTGYTNQTYLNGLYGEWNVGGANTNSGSFVDFFTFSNFSGTTATDATTLPNTEANSTVPTLMSIGKNFALITDPTSQYSLQVPDLNNIVVSNVNSAQNVTFAENCTNMTFLGTSGAEMTFVEFKANCTNNYFIPGFMNQSSFGYGFVGNYLNVGYWNYNTFAQNATGNQFGNTAYTFVAQCEFGVNFQNNVISSAAIEQNFFGSNCTENLITINYFVGNRMEFFTSNTIEGSGNVSLNDFGNGFANNTIQGSSSTFFSQNIFGATSCTANVFGGPTHGVNFSFNVINNTFQNNTFTGGMASCTCNGSLQNLTVPFSTLPTFLTFNGTVSGLTLPSSGSMSCVTFYAPNISSLDLTSATIIVSSMGSVIADNTNVLWFVYLGTNGVFQSVVPTT